MEKSLYPNPQDYKNYEELTLKYTFARGGTEILKNTLIHLNQLPDIIKSLRDKNEGKKKQFWGGLR